MDEAVNMCCQVYNNVNEMMCARHFLHGDVVKSSEKC